MLIYMDLIDPRLNSIKDCLYRVAVKVIIIQNDKLLTVAEHGGWHGLPGGGLEHGETPNVSIARELEEEIGLHSQDFTLEDRPLCITYNGVSSGIPRVCILYRATLKPTAHLRQGELSFEWLDSSKLKAIELAPSTKTAKPFLLSLLAPH